MTTIDVVVLRQVTNKIFDFIQRDLELSAVELPQNLYWDVLEQQLYAMDDKPTDLSCGSLADDADFVRIAHQDPSQAIPETFFHVAPLIRALAAVVPNYKSPGKG